ncbi:MAG: 3'-5' exonuclease [Oscillospiraceae bacterium]|nr:3'-5' exonuclease [Oscillospiraceae bacterium]
MITTTYPSDYIVLDIETTGLGTSCDIIEIAAVRVRNNVIMDEFESFVKPRGTIPWNITRLTGITNAMVAGAPPIEQVLCEFKRFVGDDVLIGHNIKSFDMRMISAKATDCGMCFGNELVDTLAMARKLLPTKHHGLADVCSYYNITNSNAHRALSDVIATHECYQRLKNE